MTKKAIIFALVAALAWMVGCDKPPEVQMTSARQAVETAQGAEVGKYAPEELSKMQDSLKAGLAEVERQNDRLFFLRNYDAAKSALAWTEQQAPKAIEKARQNKERIRKATEEIVQAASAAIDSAAAMLAAAPRGKESKEEIEMMEKDLEALRPQLDEARSLLQAEQFDQAKAKAQQVQAKAVDIQREVGAAIQKFEELMAKRKGGRRK